MKVKLNMYHHGLMVLKQFHTWRNHCFLPAEIPMNLCFQSHTIFIDKHNECLLQAYRVCLKFYQNVLPET